MITTPTFFFFKQVLLGFQGVEVFHGPKSPWTLQIIHVGKHILDISCLLVDRDAGYDSMSRKSEENTSLTSTSVAGSIQLRLLSHDIVAVVAFASNSALSVYATLFLTIRLLAHRKLMIACQEDKRPTKQHLRIVTILLQSAAINVPIVIATAVGLRTGKGFVAVTGLISAPSQVCGDWFSTYRILMLAY